MPTGVYKRKPFTEEHRRKISETLTGKHLSEEHKNNIGKAGKGRIAWNKGIKTGKRSDEFREKMRMIVTGRKASKETRMKISEVQIGKHLSKETKEKMSKTRKGNFKGHKNSVWKGGKYSTPKGYVLVLKPSHPFGNRQGYVREHRLVVEKIIGRYLLPTERVHHIGAKNDNRPHMLMAFINESAHQRFEQHKEIKPEDIIFNGRK